MSLVVDNVMECITIEIDTERTKKVLVSCVYRKPGSDIDFILYVKAESNLCLWGF